MKSPLKKSLGITLLEILLVIAIGSLILILGIRQFQQLRFQSEIDKLMFTVDTLFYGLKNFYFAQCGNTGNILTSATSTYGALQTPTDLKNAGYISAWPMISNAIVTDSNAYVLQFNRVVVSGGNGRVGVYACGPYSTATSGPTTFACSNSKTPQLLDSQIQNVRWKMQVAVKPNNTSAAMMSTYKTLTGATCITTKTGSYVTACGDSPTNVGDYLVWERTITRFNSADDMSTYWMSTPRLNQFKMQYEHDQMKELMIGSGGPPDGNYFCGG